ncbi:MAG: EAL domain-containing protein [Brevinematales bacterium]|jgi:EAL and modified HD-GYP domain-containing signal transduction protein
MNTGNILMGRQPILDCDQNIVAFELLFRNDESNFAKITDNLTATATVLVNTLNNFGFSKLMGDKLAFINVNDEILKRDLLKTLQKDRYVLEILETTKIDTVLLELIDSMKQDGFVFALDDFVFNDETIKRFSPLFSKVSYIKVDVRQNTRETIASKIKIFKSFQLDCLAEKVEDMQEFFFFKDLGFTLFQGYFFARPTIIKGKGVDPRKLAIMEIINLIYKDSDISALESSFKKWPEMTINLLQFINSAAIGSRHKIESIRQAIALLGQRQLLNWLILMEYAYMKGTSSGNPLLFAAIERAKTMEVLVKTLKTGVPKNMLDEAYLTGLLSLMEPLFRMPMKDILAELNLSKSINDALIDRTNELGKLLLLIEKSEENNFPEVSAILKELNISVDKYNSAALDGIFWAQTNGSNNFQQSYAT